MEAFLMLIIELFIWEEWIHRHLWVSTLGFFLHILKVVLKVWLRSGLPHLSMKDDFFEGKFIPAGSMLIANIWCVPSIQDLLGYAHTISNSLLKANDAWWALLPWPRSLQARTTPREGNREPREVDTWLNRIQSGWPKLFSVRLWTKVNGFILTICLHCKAEGDIVI